MNRSTSPARVFALAALLPALSTTFATSARAQCTTTRASVSSAGVEGNGTAGLPSPNVHRNFVSAEGRFVVFWSNASNLVASDTNGVADVFLRDTILGTTTRLSVDSAGVEGNGASTDPTITADGRFVAFSSAASNLVPNDTNSRVDVFVRDLVSGTTVRVSVDSAGVEGNGDSGRPDLAANGRFVVFHSRSSNLSPADTNTTQDVFVRDLVSATTTCLSIDASGVSGNGVSSNPSISASGRWVAFHSDASNLVANDTNATTDVFVRDRQTVVTTRVSTGSLEEQGNSFSQTPSISANGRYVAFSSAASSLVIGDTNLFYDVFLKDRTTGKLRMVSVSSSGALGNSTSQGNSISADGRFVAFASYASNLVANDTNGGALNLSSDVFVHDMVTGATTRASVDTNGVEGNTAGSSYNASISPDGATIAFYSGATNLVAGDTNGFDDVFVRTCGGPVPTPYCFGDGTGTPCPCGNAGLPGRGCQNSIGTGGGLIGSTGVASSSNDSLTLNVSFLPATTAVLFFQGDSDVATGQGSVFGDGLRCAGGNVLRLGVRFCQGGAAQLGAAVPTDPLISVRGLIPAGMSFRFYQAWYRNLESYCTADTYNLTNGIKVTWLP